MTTYYLSTLTGNNANSGTSSTQAWSSFSQLTGKLKAGDTVLLENGSTFTETLNLSKVYGQADAPITISNYGIGEAPILASPTGNGIHAQYTNYIIVENLTMQGTAYAGIYGASSNNWIIRNTTFDGTGGVQNNNGTINWWNSQGMLFENNTITNSHGDGIFMSNVNNVIVKDNIFMNVTGTNADNIQISGVNAEISGNLLFINDNSNTTKGNIVFQGDNLFLHDNYMEGGSFGASISADNVIIQDNVMANHDKYTWSSNIMLTDATTGDVANNIIIRNNDLSDAGRNITIDGKNATAANMTVNNLEISGNQLSEWDKAPVVVNGANLNGIYQDNIYDVSYQGLYAVGSDLSHLGISNNIVMPALTEKNISTPAPKLLTLSVAGSEFEGAPILKLLVNGIEAAQREITATNALGQKQLISFEIPTFYAGDKFSLLFSNDKFDYKTGQDRNIYIYSVSFDGYDLGLRSADLSGKVSFPKHGTGITMNSWGTATFTSDDVPQNILTKAYFAETPLPSLHDILEGGDNIAFYNGQTHTIGSTSPADYGTGFKDLTSGLDTLHQALTDNFG